MRAVVIHAAHDLRIDEMESPGAPGPGEVGVRVGAGGICGSDLHYYHDGGFGAVRVRQPMVLGHEFAGTVTGVGAGVTHVAVGDKVAVNPSRPCNACRFCLVGRQQHCLDMRFYGSAMRMPHVHGGFREEIVCDAVQAVPVPAGLALTHAAFAEPLAVCLHAVRQAGEMLGRRVLVTGAGPIGMLAMLAARLAGASEVVMTDLVDAPLALAKRLGADAALNMRSEPAGLDRFAADKGYFDVVLEASGAVVALKGAMVVARPGAVIVQLGIGADAALPLSMLTAKEISLRGSFRFHEEFGMAVDAIAAGRIDVAPLLTEVMPMGQARAAFDLASDRSRAMKVQLAF